VISRRRINIASLAIGTRVKVTEWGATAETFTIPGGGIPGRRRESSAISRPWPVVAERKVGEEVDFELDGAKKRFRR